MKDFHPTGTCPIRDILCRLGDKWSMLVMITLNVNGTMRFSDIQKTISDISQRMLTVTLRAECREEIGRFVPFDEPGYQTRLPAGRGDETNS